MQWTFTSETDLETTFNATIEPFWKSKVTEGHFSGKGGISIAYAFCIPENAKDTIVISNGRIETYLKYKELAYDFYNNGFAVFMLDHRGQGLSERMTKDPMHGFVDHFDDYVDDLVEFVSQEVKPRQQGKCYLVCHSMGSAIGALTVLRKPHLFDKAVFCSPMFGIKPALPDWLALGLIKVGLAFNALANRSSGYFFGQTPYIPLPFKLNKLTHSKTRYKHFRKLYEAFPRLQLGGVTTEWLSAARLAMNTIEQSAGAITLPVLVFSADSDVVVDNTRQRKVVGAMPNAQLKIIPHAYHELFVESDAMRSDTLNTLLNFLVEESA